MKFCVSLFCCFFFFCFQTNPSNAQKTETFGNVTYTLPKGWNKKDNAAAVMLGADGAKGTCVITVFKPLPGTNDANANFKASWEAIVKGVVKTIDAPKMLPSANEDGWTAESGSATYESDGKKGLALLVTLTGDKKVVNIFILTDTDAYQSDIAAFLESVHLPKIAAKPATPSAPQTAPGAARKSNFKFTTTNFDDGWTAVEQDDWVRVTKGNVVALIHYPNPKAIAPNATLKVGLQTAWDVLVAPRYTNVRNFVMKPVLSFESIYFAEADADDKASQKAVHLVLFKKSFYDGSGKFIEFVTDSRADFEREFGPYHNDEFNWDKCAAMQTRNRFAVAASDLPGKWSTSGGGMLSYYYANGNSAGATATSTTNAFTFAAEGTYQSDHTGASGMVGNQRFSREVFKGTFSADKWNLTLTNRFKGKTEKFACAFEAVKGGRILRLTDPNNYVYALVKQ